MSEFFFVNGKLTSDDTEVRRLVEGKGQHVKTMFFDMGDSTRKVELWTLDKRIYAIEEDSGIRRVIKYREVIA